MNHESIEEVVERKAKQRERKRKPKMRVVGKQVFTLQEIIRRPRKKKR